MHYLIKPLQEDIVAILIALASHVQAFQFDDNSQCFWLVGKETLKAHAEMWDMTCSVRALVKQMAVQLRAIGG